MEKPADNQGIVYHKPSAERWTLSGVSHRGSIGTYEVIGEMTPAMTQDKLFEKHGLEIPSMDLVWAIATRGYELRNESQDSETLRQFLRQGFRKYLNTSTRIVYGPSGKDKVIHNYGTQNHSLDEDVVGPDDWMTNIPDKNVLESLLGTQNVSQINQVSQWVNGTNAYLWRLNSKPKEKTERVAGFYAYVGRLVLVCNGGPHDEFPAFRVLKVE